MRVETPFDDVTYRIIGVGMAVHNELGPGFSEEIYQRALTVAFQMEGLRAEREKSISIPFRDQVLGRFELDFVVQDSVVVEVKALSSLSSVHEQQVIAYLAASGLPIGLLLNFGCSQLQRKRIFPPRSVQTSPAYQARNR